MFPSFGPLRDFSKPELAKRLKGKVVAYSSYLNTIMNYPEHCAQGILESVRLGRYCSFLINGTWYPYIREVTEKRRSDSVGLHCGTI